MLQRSQQDRIQRGGDGVDGVDGLEYEVTIGQDPG